jgi:hypothetical protein
VHKVIITLTTISSRLDHVHLVIESLVAQDFPAHAYEVRLHLSKQPYLLDQGCPTLTAELQRLQRDNRGRFSVVYVENTGPYRKLLPVLNEVYDYESEEFRKILIVTADDDTAYPPYFLNRLYVHYLKYRCVIGYRGRAMRFDNGKLAPYKKWQKTIQENSSLLNVPTGKDGVLYSPLHFNPKILDISLAQQHAPKADDLWVKVHTLLSGTPSFIINRELDQEFASVTGKVPEASLYRSFNDKGGNDEAMNNLENYLMNNLNMNIGDLCTPKTSTLTLRIIDQIKGLINVE